MNRAFKRLWSAIERLPDLAAVPGEWRSLLGSEYELAGRFLLPTQRIARSGKCTVPDRNCVHEFRPWKGEYLSVCPDGCDTVTLPRDEVVIHRLDAAALGREIGEAMGLEALPAEAVPELPNVLRIGEYVLAGHRFPVCLVFTGEPDQLRCDVDGLAARAEPFVLLAPTRSAVTHACADLFKRAKSSFLPLNELLGQGDDGRLALLDGHATDNVLADFRAIQVSQPEDTKQAAEETVSMRELLHDRALLVGALLEHHKHGQGTKRFVREAATAESLAKTLGWTPERVRETFVLLPSGSYEAYRQGCERGAANRCLYRYSRLKARPGKALTPPKWAVFWMTRAVTVLGLAKESLPDIHRLLMARSVTNLPNYGTFKKAVQRAAFRQNDKGEWERQYPFSCAARPSLAQKELAARPSPSARVRPPARPAQKGAAAPKVCASCKDDFKPYECSECEKMIVDRCQKCHAEKAHGNLIP